MKLTTFPEQTFTIAENQSEYMPMPAHVDKEGRVTCCWELTPEELAEVQRTGKIWHQILTFGWPMQPQLLLATKPVFE